MTSKDVMGKIPIRSHKIYGLRAFKLNKYFEKMMKYRYADELCMDRPRGLLLEACLNRINFQSDGCMQYWILISKSEDVNTWRLNDLMRNIFNLLIWQWDKRRHETDIILISFRLHSFESWIPVYIVFIRFVENCRGKIEGMPLVANIDFKSIWIWTKKNFCLWKTSVCIPLCNTLQLCPGGTCSYYYIFHGVVCARAHCFTVIDSTLLLESSEWNKTKSAARATAKLR